MIYIDFETRSEVDIKESGSWVYSLHPSTQILCLAFKTPNTEPKLFVSGFETNQEIKNLFDRFIKTGEIFESHNAFFEKGIWQNILVKKYGWDRGVMSVGEKNLLKLGFNNDPMEFLNMYNNLDVVQSEEEPDWTLFRYKPKENLMIYDRKNDVVYINYHKIWSVLQNNFELNYNETQKLTERWLDEVYNLRGVTTTVFRVTNAGLVGRGLQFKGNHNPI